MKKETIKNFKDIFGKKNKLQVIEYHGHKFVTTKKGLVEISKVFKYSGILKPGDLKSEEVKVKEKKSKKEKKVVESQVNTDSKQEEYYKEAYEKLTAEKLLLDKKVANLESEIMENSITIVNLSNDNKKLSVENSEVGNLQKALKDAEEKVTSLQNRVCELEDLCTNAAEESDESQESFKSFGFKEFTELVGDDNITPGAYVLNGLVATNGDNFYPVELIFINGVTPVLQVVDPAYNNASYYTLAFVYREPRTNETTGSGSTLHVFDTKFRFAGYLKLTKATSKSLSEYMVGISNYAFTNLVFMGEFMIKAENIHNYIDFCVDENLNEDGVYFHNLVKSDNKIKIDNVELESNSEDTKE